MTAHMRIDIFSDPTCPWCFLGKRRFELALARRPQYEPRVTWRPFELNPDLPSEGVDRAWFLATRIGDQERFAETQKTLTELGAMVGIHYRFDLIARVAHDTAVGREHRQSDSLRVYRNLVNGGHERVGG